MKMLKAFRYRIYPTKPQLAQPFYSRQTDGGAVCGGPGNGRPMKQKLRTARAATRPKKAGADKAPAFRPV